MIKLPNLKGLAVIGKAAIAAHRPEILFGTSIVTTISAVVMAGRGGYKSGQEVLLAEQERGMEMDVKEKIQTTYQNYVPAAGLTLGALGATTGLHIVHIKEKKAIAAAALMAIDEVKEQSKEYVDNAIDSVKEHAGEDVANKVTTDVIDPDKDGKIQIENTDHEIEELYLVRDAHTGRDIWSNQVRIEDAANVVNKWIASHNDCDLNSFYNNAGFESLPDGESWGWSGEMLELQWDATVRDDGRPVKRFTFRSEPEKGYDAAVK